MESPDKYYTNVFKIENLARIPYRVFCPNIKPEHHGPLENNRSLWARYAQSLRLAEKYLRENSIVAYVDYEENEAWIFDIPVPSEEDVEVQNVPFEAFVKLGLVEPKTTSSKDQPVTMEAPLKEFPSDCGMALWKEGTFLATSLNPPPPMPPRTPIIDLTGTDDGKTDEGSEEDTPERVWQFLVGAVLSTLSHRLSNTAKFLPLSLRDFVSLPHVEFPEPEEDMFADELWYSEYFGKVICSLDMHMASSGILCITASSRLVKGFGQLIHTMEDNSFIAGRSIWLAPWGQVGQAVSALSEKELSSFRAQEWKKNVQEYLDSKGLKSYRREFGLDGTWIRVNVKREDIDGNGHEEETLWPAALCFVREHEGDETLSEIPELPTSIGFARNPLGSLYHEFYQDVHDPERLEEAENKRLEAAMKELIEKTPEAAKHGLRTTGNLRIMRFEEDTGLGWFEHEGNSVPDPLGSVLKLSDEGGTEAFLQLMKGGSIDRNVAEDLSKTKGKGKGKESQPPNQTPMGMPTPSAVYPTPPTAPQHPTARHEGALTLETNVASSSGQMDLDQDDWLSASAAPKSEDLEDDVLDDLMEGGAFVTDKDFDFFDEPNPADDDDIDLGLDTLDYEPMSHNITRSPDADTSMGGMVPSRQDFAPKLESTVYQDRIMATTEHHLGLELDSNHVQTPPLSPHHAMTLLIPEYSAANQQSQHISPAMEGNPSSSLDQRKGSLYAPMNFLPNVEMADKKYQAGGRFYVAPEEDMEELEKITTKITLDSPINQSKGTNIKTPTPRFADFTPGTERSGRDDAMGVFSSDESDSTSGEYASSSSENENADNEYLQPGKRKRGQEDIDGIASSDDEEDLAQNISELLPWQLLIPDPNDASLVDVFNTLDLQHLGCVDLVDSDYIGTSRIVADQLMGSFIQPLWRDYSIGTNDTELKYEVTDRKITDESLFYSTLIEVFPQALKCTVETYAAITDAIPEPLGRVVNRPVPQLRRPPPLRTVGSHVPSGTSSPTTESPPAPSIFRIEAPHVHVHRGDYALDILPASLHYWETFSFSPCVGPKNVFALCVYPDGGQPLVEGVDAFLDNVGPLYDACRLGLHLLVDLPASQYFSEITKGQVPWKIGNSATTSSAMESLMRLSGELGVHLMSIGDEGQNIVIYVVNPFRHPAAIAEISRAFVKLKRSYKTCMDNARRRPNNLVLQIVPINWVVAPDSLVVLPFQKARILAMEVYSRCSLSLEKNGSEYVEIPPSIPFANNAPISICKPIANAIEFKLSAEPSPALLMENSMMHVAYACSVDDRWIVAAWSDNWGKIKRMESYCLARRGQQPFRSFNDVYKEIWKATMEVIRFKNVHWRLIFTKVGLPVTEDEVEEWTQLQGSPVGLNFAMRTPSVIILSCTLQPDLSISVPGSSMDWSQLGLPENVEDWPKEPPPDLRDILKDIAEEVEVKNSWKKRKNGGVYYAPKSFIEVWRQLEENRQKSAGAADPKGKKQAAEPEKKKKVVASDPSTWPEVDQSEIDATTSTLIDLADETWGLVLNHKTPHHAAITEFGPITTTAYQVCRGTTEAKDRSAVIQFNIVHWTNVNTTSTTCAQNEQALAREILEGWRGLRFLDWGERRGCPWHIAAVDRGIQIGEIM